MMELAGVMACVLGSVVLLLWGHHCCFQRRSLATAAAQTVRASTPQFIPVLLSAFVVVLSVVIYSTTGRFSDWNSGRVDENIDYLLAADITKGRQALEQTPDDEIALLNLAQSYAAGGMYADAVTTLEQLLQLTGEDAELLGMQATAMYYRDERTIAPQTGIIIGRALALHREELQTRLLLATDAYLKGEYAKAIEHWQILLENRQQPVNRTAINNAILKAQNKLNPQG
ncbi:nitrite reductase [Shewanella sp. NFH-SH190041]|uniref:tetratricopeptide repeat protein n=1 Tax=Shewanella sp. NFH-SH190041 TaxID=2950245 RepID=UPI0021C3E978|nr:tetratricopeptide repeat protein [Shewanella sp. NFH-SH190041]BDM65600.1 nitrite reductase [Shewanella sp. NFH-SH190041]